MKLGLLIINPEIVKISRERKDEDERTSDWKYDPSVNNFTSCITTGFRLVYSSSLIFCETNLSNSNKNSEEN